MYLCINHCFRFRYWWCLQRAILQPLSIWSEVVHLIGKMYLCINHCFHFRYWWCLQRAIHQPLSIWSEVVLLMHLIGKMYLCINHCFRFRYFWCLQTAILKPLSIWSEVVLLMHLIGFYVFKEPFFSHYPFDRKWSFWCIWSEFMSICYEEYFKCGFFLGSVLPCAV